MNRPRKRSALDVSAATIRAPGGRLLFDGLDLRLTREHVALVGRNGVGKSTLLAVLAGAMNPSSGRVHVSARVHFVAQAVDARAGAHSVQHLSRGQKRRVALEQARSSEAEVLLLDEPTEDLDEEGVAWLRSWLPRWPGCVVVASHDRRLLGDFQHFFVASESGCRHFAGTLGDLEEELEVMKAAEEERYARTLRRLAAHEEHTLHVERRKARKKRYGRCSEIDRATAPIRLNAKRGQAQVSHAHAAKVREARLGSLRKWSKATRRSLAVELGMNLPVAELPAARDDVLVLRDVSIRAGADGPMIVTGLDLALGRQRVALVGPNGAGKTTLLDVMLGHRRPASGVASRELSRIGFVAQGGTNWMSDESLLAWLALEGSVGRSAEEIASIVARHRFPLALAERPMRSLSPGERMRAALVCLFERRPAIELLVLDEPTHSLDLLGQRALTAALRAWRGGLLVASHDRAFLCEIGVNATIELSSDSRPVGELWPTTRES